MGDYMVPYHELLAGFPAEFNLVPRVLAIFKMADGGEDLRCKKSTNRGVLSHDTHLSFVFATLFSGSIVF